MNIGYVSSDWGRTVPGAVPPPGGAGWVRIHQPALELAKNGHRTVVGSGIAARPDDVLVPLGHDGVPLMVDPDILIIQRWMNEDAPQAIRAARAAGQIIVQDIDDWFWGLHEGNRAYYTTDKRVSPEHNRDHYKAAVAASDAVTVSTQFLAKRIRERIGTRTFLVRNAVDPATFATQPVRDAREGLVIGWTGALQWRSGDLETLRNVLPDFLTQTGSTFVHHGVFPGEPDHAAAKIMRIPEDTWGPTLPGVPPQDYPGNVAGFDIGLVPLNDVPFNHAKSWIKGLEYAAAGIPFVAYRTVEYEALGCGLLASTPAEWAANLWALTDPEVRAEQQALGLKVATEHSIHTRWRDWERIYLMLTGRV